MLQYLIKWKGYPKSDNMWENADQIHAPILIKLYHQTNTLESTKACHIRFECQHPPLLLSKTHSFLATPSPTIINPSTAALVWTRDHEETTRLACSPHLLP
jgi:Chromo (CHRromatin Organisation MOdifier) domain